MVHLVEQAKNGLASQLGHGLGNGLAHEGPLADQRLVGRVHKLKRVLRPVEDANHGWGLLQYLVQLPALQVGLGAGRLRLALAGAQGRLHIGAGGIGSIGKAHQEPLTYPAGRELKVIIQAICLVIKG